MDWSCCGALSWYHWWRWTNTYCGVLKVIKAVVCEDEPSAFPGFHTSSWNSRAQQSWEETFYGSACQQGILWLCALFTVSGWVHTSWENKQQQQQRMWIAGKKQRERESRGRDRGRRKRTILLVSQIRGLAMQRKTIRILVHNAESWQSEWR